MRVGVGLAVLAAAIIPLPLFAQATVTMPSGSADAGAPISDHARPAAVRAELTGGTKDKTASLSLDLLRLDTLVVKDTTTAEVRDQSLELVLSTPWDKENDAFALDLDGLADGTTFKLTFRDYHSKRITVSTREMEELEGRATAACLADKGQKIGAKPEEADLKCTTLGNDGLTLVRAYLTDREERAYASTFFASDLGAFGLQGAIELQSFKYVDPLSLAGSKDKEISWSAGAHYTWYVRETPTALTFAADYERAYKADDAVILCPASAGPNPVECVNKPDAPPTPDKSLLVTANLRHRFLINDELSRFAISPKVVYDAMDNEFGVELPVYFIPDGKEGLVAGVKAGYQSEEDEFAIGIFIGAAFGLVQ